MATLTSTITESVTLNGAVRGSTQNVTISDIDQVAEKIMECPAGAGETGAPTIIGNWANVTNAAKYQSYDYTQSQYVRVTNLNETVSIRVAFVSNGLNDQCDGKGAAVADTCNFQLRPYESAIMWQTTRGKLGEATEPVYTNTMTDLSYIAIWNPTFGETAEAVNIELFVAGNTKA
mgnify:CR=1 FL=1